MVIVVAGMEGALPSVVGGLVAVPVIAVPTSVGYGASFGGLAALLGDAQLVRGGGDGGQHRQRVRRGGRGEPDLPRMTVRKLLERSEPALVWLDVVSPTVEELEQLAREHGLPAMAVKDCLDPEHLPKFEQFDGQSFIIIRAFDSESEASCATVQELTRKVAIFSSPGLLITIHRTEQQWLASLEDRLAAEPGAKGGKEAYQAYLLTQVLNGAVDTYLKPMERIDPLAHRRQSRHSLAGGIARVRARARPDRRVRNHRRSRPRSRATGASEGSPALLRCRGRSAARALERGHPRPDPRQPRSTTRSSTRPRAGVRLRIRAACEASSSRGGCRLRHRHSQRRPARVFERFYRVDRARSRDLGGTGLGLSIVKHLALRMRADVTVESPLGKGTTFRLFLPTEGP